MKDYKKTASEILKHVGGEKNVSHLEHCSTRLRFSLVDSKKANIDALKATPGVMGVVMTAQCQVIIGNDVVEVYDAIMAMAHFDGAAAPASVGRFVENGVTYVSQTALLQALDLYLAN